MLSCDITAISKNSHKTICDKLHMQEWHKQAQRSSDQDSSTELVKPASQLTKWRRGDVVATLVVRCGDVRL